MAYAHLHPGVAMSGPAHSLLHGIWRLADPKIALASLVPFCIGVSLVWRETRVIDAGIAGVILPLPMTLCGFRAQKLTTEA